VAGRRHLTAIASRVLPTTLAWSLSDAEGQTLIGDASPLPSAAVRPAAAAGLPWTLHVFNAPGPQPPTPQRPFLLLVLVLVTLVLGAGWFFIFRSLARERQIAELQSDFVAAVSHEFRSPLTSIGHISELLAHGRLEADGPRREAYGVLVRDTARLRGLVEGLLDFGRFDAGPSAFRFEEIDVGELVETTVADFRDRAAAEGFRIDVVGSLESVVARADREAMTRALWNLLDNAVKYSPDSRTIRVELAATGDRVAVGVRDRGIGIPSEEQQRIFDRFVRGTAAKSRRIRGTGIGLAMVRQIVAAHGGEIAVASEPGQGSCFTIQLPVVSRGSETWRACSSSKTNPALPSA
jgi:signal transduction histidine kinase